MKSFTHNHYILREIARDAAARSQAEAREALVAIVFSAMAIEAMVNEVELVAVFVAQSPGNEGAVALADLLRRAEEAHANLWLKVSIIVAAVAGKPFDEDNAVFNDVKLLFQLRDALVHLKGELVDHSVSSDELFKLTRKMIKRLVGRNILARAELKPGKALIDTLAVPSVAEWACSLPAQFATEVVQQLPETWFSLYLHDGWFEFEKRETLPALWEQLRARFPTQSD